MDIHTRRLHIHPVHLEDAEAIARIWSSKRVTRFLGGPRDKAAVRRALREYADRDDPFDLWAVTDEASGTVVGHCGLLPRRIGPEDEVEIVYVIGWKHWGQGYATEAARALIDHAWEQGLDRLIALIEPGNAASVKVAHKLGFVYERMVERPGARRVAQYALERDRRHPR